MKGYKFNKEKLYANIGRATTYLGMYGIALGIATKGMIYVLFNCITTIR